MRKRRVKRRVVAILAVITVLFTTNQLRFSADTLERLPACGLLEHTHTQACFDAFGNLDCGLEAHVHSDACYQQRPVSGDDVEPGVEEVDPDALLAEVEEASGADGEALALPQDDAPEAEYVYNLGGKDHAKLSRILKKAHTGLTIDDVEQVGENVLEGQPLSLRVAPRKDDYNIICLRSFTGEDAVELAVFTVDGGAQVIRLKNGAEFQEATEPEKAPEPMAEVEELAVVEAAEAIPEEAVEEIAGEPVEEIVEEAVEETDEKPVEEEIEEHVEETVEEPVGEEPVEAVEEPTVEETVEFTEEETEEATEEADEEAIEKEAGEPSDGETETEEPAEEEPIEEEPVEEEPVEFIGEELVAPVEEETVEVAEEELAGLVEEETEEPTEEEYEEPIEEEIEESTEEESEEPIEEETEEPIEEESEEPTEEESEEPTEKETEDTEKEGTEEEIRDSTEEETEEPTEEESEDTGKEETEEEIGDSTEEETEEPAEEESEDTESEDTESEDTEKEETEEETQEATEADPEAPHTPDPQVLDVDVSDLEAPFSLAGLLGCPLAEVPTLASNAAPVLTPAAETEEVALALSDDAGEASAFEPADDAPGGASGAEDDADVPAPRGWRVDWDPEVLDVRREGDDFLIAPRRSFDATTLNIEGEDRYILNLLNYAYYPAQSFECRVDGMVVTVVADAGAFPADTSMTVTAVDDEPTLTDLAGAVETDGVAVERIHAVDITFRDAEGGEIEPLRPISVSLSVDEIPQAQGAVVVHLDDNGDTQVMAQREAEAAGQAEAADQAEALAEPEPAAEDVSEGGETTVAFEADAFSVYALIVTKKLETRVLASDGETYRIEVSFGEGANIPDGATLRAEEVVDASREDYLAQTARVVGDDKVITLARYFDIAILDAEGDEVQPAEPVQVNVTLDDAGDDPVCAVHFAEDGPERVEARREDQEVVFDAEGFSVWGIVYTVDFHYAFDGQRFDASIPGGDCVSLRALLPLLGIAADDPETDADELSAFMEAVASVTFSDPALVWVCPVTEDTTVGGLRAALGIESVYSEALTPEDRDAIEGRALVAPDWALFSLAPFTTDETLTVAMNNGDSFAIAVTDAQIATRVLAADGSAYRITLTFGPEAGIPLDAALRAEEIPQYSAAWLDYAVEAAKALDADALEALSGNRFFDIEILSGGERIEPSAAVTVDIALDGAEPAEGDHRVVHFGQDGPVEVRTQAAEGADIRFEAESFSVYGVITVDSAPTGVGDLAGRTFTMNHGGQYVTSNIVGADPTKFGETGDAAQATVWQFEATGQDGRYFISTVVGGEKKYMRLTKYSKEPAKAYAHLEDSPQSFTVVDNGDGTYSLQAYTGGGSYFLNDFNGSYGFAGWYTRSAGDDRFALTFKDPVTAADSKYLLLTKYEDSYYVILNDGTLSKVTDPSIVNGQLRFEVDDPMAWTYTGDNLYHNAKEAGFNGSDLASDYYYRYMNPDVDSAYTDEDINTTEGHPGWSATEYFITGRPLMDQIKINYSNHTISSRTNPYNFIGIASTGEGRLRIVGRQDRDHAAEIYFVKLLDEDILKYRHDDRVHHTVNHIDISIVGHAAFTVPLAYGTYYYNDGGEVKTLVVNRENPVTVEIAQDVPVDREDIKRANVVAYTEDPATGEHKVLDNAFYISGYSGNNESDVGSTNQTRIEGVFKVADLPVLQKDYTMYIPEYTDNNGVHHDRKNISGPDDRDNLWAERLAHKVYYSVSTTKQVSFDLKYNNHTLYDDPGKAAGGEAGVLRGATTVTLSNSFNYWDRRNECPPIYLWAGGLQTWSEGNILYGGQDSDGSGMDFALGTIDKDKYGVLALEITKLIVDEAGNTITPKENVNNVFHIYRKAGSTPGDVRGMDVDRYADGLEGFDYSGYRPVHDKKATVGVGGTGSVYDYDVQAGMVYIEEDKGEDSLPRELEDADGRVWLYSGTRIETEYVWRDDGIEDRRHVSKEYKDDADANYRSHPEVLGSYKDVNGVDRYNGFLEYFVYNIYRQEPIDVPVRKVWRHEDGSLAEAPAGASVRVKLGRFALVKDPETFEAGTLQINHSVSGWDADPRSTRAYYAAYKLMQGNKVVRSASYDRANPSIQLRDIPAGSYTLVLSESVNQYSATTTVNGASAASVPVTIAKDQTAEVNVATALAQVGTQSLVTVHIKKWQSDKTDAPLSALDYTFPAGSRIVVTIYRPAGAYSGTDFQAWYRCYRQGEGVPDYANLPWPEGVTDWVYADQEWHVPTALPNEDGAEFTIELKHNWDDREFRIVAVELEKEAGVQSNARRFRASAASNAVAANDAAVLRVTPSGEAPKSNIPGKKYAPDAAWSGAEVTLTNGHWEDVFTDLPAADGEGCKYLYYIESVEERGFPEGCVCEIDGDSATIRTSDGEQTLGVTNTIGYDKPKVTLRKVDENGRPLKGATFQLSANGGTPEAKTINADDATYTMDGPYGRGLPDGAYVISEIQAPGGYQSIGAVAGNISFVVAEGKLTQVSYPSSVVSFDGESYTFTITNKPVEDAGKLKIVKRWQAFDGSVEEGDHPQVQLQLVQMAQDERLKHVVRMWFYVRGDGQDSAEVKTQDFTEIASRMNVVQGDAIVEWNWNQYTTIGTWAIQIEGVDQDRYSITQTTINDNGDDKVHNTLVIRDVGDGRDVNVRVYVSNGNWRCFDYGEGGSVGDIHGIGGFMGDDTFTLTGGSRTVTLNSGNGWSQEFTYGENEDSPLANNGSTVLPKSYKGRPCRYIIAEPSVPAGYTVSYSSSNDGGEGSSAFTVNAEATGVLTAYNRKNQTDVKLVKVDKYDRAKALSGAKFEIKLLNPSQKGVVYMDWTDPADHTTDDNGETTFADLPVGYYEIRETQAPERYHIVGDGALYIKVTQAGVFAVERNDDRYPDKWKARPNDSMIAVNDSVVFAGNEKDQPVKLRKVDSSDTGKALEGAQFDLYGPYAPSDIAAGVFGSQPDRKVDRVIRTDDQGEADLGLLQTGYYYLYETQAPAGYNLLTAPVIIMVNSRANPITYDQTMDSGSTNLSSSGSGIAVETDEDGVDTYVLTVVNTAGARLPNTGGVGTGLYTGVGAALALLAIALLLGKLRRAD